MEEIKGEFKTIIFHNDSNYYTVARFVDYDTYESIMVTGNFVELQKDITYRLHGEYVDHPKYGFQFQCISYAKILPTDYDAQVAFLASPIFPGIGPKQAVTIVDALGEKVFDLIKEDPSVLDGIKGLTKKKREVIVEGLRNNMNLEELIGFFASVGLGMKSILKLQQYYGENVLSVTYNNPYQLSEEVDGFGFATSDKIAANLDYDMHSYERSHAALSTLVMDECFKRGDTYLLYDELQILLERKLGHNDFNLDMLLNQLEHEKILFVEESRVYHHSQYQAEVAISSYFANFLNDLDVDIPSSRINDYVDEIESENGIAYDETQRDAITMFIRKSFMILTGGPGTGKTTIVKAMIDLYHKLYPSRPIAICAPTGRAAKRLSEVTGEDATTIHRLLKWNLESNKFAMDEENPLVADLIVIDEFSMVDPYLLHQLIKACKNVSKVLFIGDEDQLPSVSCGATLRDLINCDLFPVYRLEKIYRQSEGSDVVKIAHDIKYGNEFTLNELNDVKVYPADVGSCRELVKKIIGFALEKGYDLSQLQVLAPKYAGTNGIDALNKEIQGLVNPESKDKKQLKVGNRIFREGDKILQLKNQIDDDVYNGDIGTLEEVLLKEDEYDKVDKLVVNFDGNLITYSGETLANITHAYCISIHKSQGSEYKIVIMPIMSEYFGMLSKKLIYTGITRARNSLIFVGDERIIYKGLSINERERKTTLKERLTIFANNAKTYDF